MKHILALALIVLVSGCCISVRNRAVETRLVKSEFYCVYTNGTQYTANGHTYNRTMFYNCSYFGGPYAKSFIYPGTRYTLNALSLYSFSTASSGSYMLIPPTVICYPIVVCELPIQLVLDTVLLPYDLWNTPNPPKGWELAY